MTTQKRVLVTGAGGFVCRHIVGALLTHGYDVVAADRGFDVDLLDTWRQTWSSRIETIQTDLSTLPDMPVHTVIHGAALTASADESGLTPENHLRANLEPTLMLLDWAERNRASRTVCISSSAVYEQTGGVVTEEQPPTPHNLYAIAKATTEAFVQTLRRNFGRDVITIRLSNVYGAGERRRETRPRVSLVTQMVSDALTKHIITVPKSAVTRDWTFAPNIGQAVCHLLEKAQLTHALYNVASQQHLTDLALAQIIASQLSCVKIIVANTAQPRTTRQGYLSHQRLLDETGFDAWTSLADGLAQVIQFQRDVEVVS